MRRSLLALAILAASFLGLSLAAQPASAMTLPVPAGINGALLDQSLVEEAAYVCRRRCGYYGCTRRCWWTGPRYRYRYYRPYRYYRW